MASRDESVKESHDEVAHPEPAIIAYEDTSLLGDCSEHATESGKGMSPIQTVRDIAAIDVDLDLPSPKGADSLHRTFRQLIDSSSGLSCNDDETSYDITPNDLMHVLCNLGEYVDEGMAVRMVEFASGDKSVMQRAHFDALMVAEARPVPPSTGQSTPRYPTPRELASEGVDEVAELFKLIDEDGNGTLDEHEVSKLSSKLGQRLKRVQMVDAMSAMDPEQKGVVDIKMFRKWWVEQKTHWSTMVVLPESIVQLLRKEVGLAETCPEDPKAMWDRLAMLLEKLVVIMEQRAQAMGSEPVQLCPHPDNDEADEYSPEAKARAKRCFLLPSSPMRQLWDGVQVFLLMYVLIMVPYRTCFGVEVTLWSGWFWFDAIVDLYFVADIGLNFRTAYYDGKTGELEIQQFRIARNYIFSWFTLDVASCFPASYIKHFSDEPANEGNNSSAIRALKIFRILRMMKMLRVFRIAQLINRYDEYIRPYIVSMRLFIMIFLLTIIAHAAACLWYAIGLDADEFSDGTTVRGWTLQRWDAHLCNATTGLGVAPGLGPLGVDICEHVPNFSKYVTSMYWAISTISTVGYGDISANTSTEMLMCFAAEILGVLLFGALSGMLSNMLFGTRGAAHDYECQMDRIRTYLDTAGISHSTRRLIIAFYERLWGGNVFSEKKIVGRLPDGLRLSIASELFGARGSRFMYSSVSLLSRLDEEMAYRICLAMESTVGLHREKIIRQGYFGEHMFVIEAGQVDVIKESTNGTSYKLGRLGVHGFFGELAVLGPDSRPYARTIRARNACTLAVLSKTELDDLRKKFTRIDQHFSAFQSQIYGQCRILLAPVRHNDDLDESDSVLRRIAEIELLLGNLKVAVSNMKANTK